MLAAVPTFRIRTVSRNSSTLLSHGARNVRMISSITRPCIISPKELPSLLERKATALDSTWYLPNVPRNAKEEFLQQRLPGARFFDVDAVKNESSPYPHMLPSAETWSEAMKNLGISRDSEVIVYDRSSLGIFSAARVFWMFKAIQVLSKKAFANLQNDYPVIEPDLSMVTNYEEMMKLVENRGDIQILDARPAGRFKGVDPEPRPGMPNGHIPGSISTPFSDFLNPDTKILKSRDEIKTYLESRGVDLSRPIISMCGTGVTACVVDTSLELVGGKRRSVYDGSWT